MSDLSAKFTALEGQLTSEHAAIMASIASLQTSLDLVASNTDLALENGAANTKALLAALGQSGACFPCPTPSITVPTIPSTATPIDSDRCKRAQWIIATIHSLLANMDTLQSYNVVGTFSVINDAISQVIGAIAAGDTIPLPSFPEAVNIVGDYFSYAGERIFSGVDLISQFGPLETSLINATYFGGSASGSQSAYNTVVDSSGASNGAKLLFKAIAYNALWDYAFDPASTPDLTAFDGSICSGSLHNITTCTTFAATQENPGGFYIWELKLPPHYVLNGDFIAGDYNGWGFRLVSGTAGKAIKVEYVSGGGGTTLAFQMIPGDPQHVITHATDAIRISTVDNGLGNAFAFSMEICPP